MVLASKLILLLESAWLAFGFAWWYWPAPCEHDCSIGGWLLSVMLFGFWAAGELALAILAVIATAYLVWRQQRASS